MVNTSKKSIELWKSAQTRKLCFVHYGSDVEKVSFSRSRKNKPTKLLWLQNKTSMRILVFFLKQLRLNSVLLSGHLISFNKKHRLKNVFTISSKSSMQNVLYFCIFPLPYIEISEIGISFSVTDLVRTKLMHALPIFIIFFGISFHGNIDYLQLTHSTKLNPFSKN